MVSCSTIGRRLMGLDWESRSRKCTCLTRMEPESGTLDCELRPRLFSSSFRKSCTALCSVQRAACVFGVPRESQKPVLAS